MGMDIDYLAATVKIQELQKLLESIEHGKREEIADAIIEMIDNFIEEWQNKES